MKVENKIDFSSIDWVEVLSRFCIDVSGMDPKKHYPCPLEHGDSKPRFRFDNRDGRGTWICSNCGAGDGVKLIAESQGLTVVQAILAIKDAFSQPGITVTVVPKRMTAVPSSKKTEQEIRWNKQRLQEVWNSSSPIQGSPVEKYLRRRVPGLDIPAITPLIRYHPRLEYRNEKGQLVEHLPGMIAQVIGNDNVPITIHRTYVSADGFRADVPVRKKLMPGVRLLEGEFIPLNRAVTRSGVLIVCEGIETGLALVALTGNKHEVWSMINAGNLAKVIVPKRFNGVIIAADRDKINRLGYRTGEHYAEILYKRLIEEGFKCTIRVPKEEKTDYCDLWIQKQVE